MNKWLQNSGIIASAILLTACARVGSLSGGERDEQPPRLIYLNPPMKATNVNTQRLILEFDEFVALKNANQEMVISPPLNEAPTFKLKQKKLVVEWQDTLQENTTYLFQFGNGVVDFNEGNVWDSNLVVFSTGPVIDSLELSGELIDAFTMQPVAEAWVMLYRQNIDSLPLTTLPNYFAKSDEQGKFTLKYLRSGDYKIFALVDENGGYKYDVPTELHGYQAALVRPVPPNDSLDSTNIKLRMFVAEDTLQYLKSFQQNKSLGLKLMFNRPVDSLKIEELTLQQDPALWIRDWSKSNDTLNLWFPTSFEYDSLWVRLVAEGIEDTLFLTKPGNTGRGKTKKAEEEDDESKVVLKSNARPKLPYFKPWVLKSKTPLDTNIRWSRMLFVEGKDTMAMPAKLAGNSIVIDHPWKQDREYRIFIPDSTIFDLYGHTNDTIKLTTTTTRSEDYGEVVVNYELPASPQYLWELLSEDGKLVQRMTFNASNGSVAHPHMKPGKYQIRLVLDANSNGKWDTGKYPDQQPESVIYFDEAIEVRGNWVTELNWSLAASQRN